LLELAKSFLIVNNASMIQAIRSKTQWMEPTKELITSARISFILAAFELGGKNIPGSSRGPVFSCGPVPGLAFIFAATILDWS